MRSDGEYRYGFGDMLEKSEEFRSFSRVRYKHHSIVLPLKLDPKAGLNLGSAYLSYVAQIPMQCLGRM